MKSYLQQIKKNVGSRSRKSLIINKCTNEMPGPGKAQAWIFSFLEPKILNKLSMLAWGWVKIWMDRFDLCFTTIWKGSKI